MIASSNYQEMQTGPSPSSSSHAQAVSGEDKRPYYGKCQYKTGKCFNERTLKRNGDAHSLCEEHRIKQNLIQRRSDRKYQTVHAIRRRERSQRRAVLKKQVSMAVAQQLFYEHQQQKSIGIQQLSAGHPLSTLAPAHSHSHSHAHTHLHVPPHGLDHALHSVASLAPPIQIPGKMDLSHFIGGPSSFLSSAEGLASPILSFAVAPAPSSRSFVEGSLSAERDHKMEADDDDDDDDDEEDGNDEREDTSSRSAALQHRQQQASQYKQKQLQRETTASAADHVKEENASPTGIDDFAPDSFLSICASEEDSDAAYANLVPIMSTMGEKEMWTEDDIEFLQNLLLA